METTRVFTNGRSQAVRIPKEYRFAVDEVYINKIGDTVMLTPIMPFPITPIVVTPGIFIIVTPVSKGFVHCIFSISQCGHPFV